MLQIVAHMRDICYLLVCVATCLLTLQTSIVIYHCC